ncbi:VasL domain-containing protein [Enterobacter ludwigii]|uniref:VasL domain-containing protein n=1 Tax=Enterobacter ludwigii TaxID=299767 RepID=UPI003BEEB0F1
MHETQQALNVGLDPRVLPEYERLRNEINKLSHISRPEVDWGLVHQMAQAIFEKQGVDLQTALYFTLARARLHGLSGFTEGCEFLSNLIVTQWDNVWPPVHQSRARVEILDWFIARVSDVVRQYPVGHNDKRLIYRCERSLQLLSEKLHNAGLDRVPRIENLLHFIEGYTRLFDESEIVIVSPEQDVLKKEMQVPPVVYFRSDDADESVAPDMARLPAGSIIVGREKGTMKPTVLKIKPHQPPRPAWVWFVSGMVSCLLPVLMVAGWDHWNALQSSREHDATAMLTTNALTWPVAPDAARLSDARMALGEQALRDMEPRISRDYQAQLAHVQQLSPLWVYQYADGLRRSLRMLYPQSLAVSAMDSQWQQMMNTQRGVTPSVSGWSDATVRVDALLTQLQSLERLHKTVTISYLKSSLYDIRKDMDRDTPFSVRLNRLEALQRANQTVSQAELDALQSTLKSYSVRLYQLQPAPRDL